MQYIYKIFVRWLPLGFAITVLCGLVYLAVQQSYRMDANDPQIMLAENIAEALGSGDTVSSIVPQEKIDISKKLDPYIILFDTDGKPTAGNAILDGNLPTIPAGVFDSVRNFGQSRITWQPKVGFRSAIVVEQFSGKQSGFVLIGRSLREVEKRESQLLLEVLVAWLVAMVGSFILKSAPGFLNSLKKNE